MAASRANAEADDAFAVGRDDVASVGINDVAAGAAADAILTAAIGAHDVVQPRARNSVGRVGSPTCEQRLIVLALAVDDPDARVNAVCVEVVRNERPVRRGGCEPGVVWPP